MASFRFALIALFALTFSLTARAAADDCSAICTDGEACIAAALYPYVPDTAPFATSLCAAWSAANRPERLYIIADEAVWDGGYSSNPVYTNGSGAQAPIDVFVYDAMYLNYWTQHTVPVPAGYITNPGDFVPYARDALVQLDNDMLALPMLGCTNIMFYLDNDQGMAGVTTLSQFFNVNPQGVYISPVPFGRSGAMLDMTGKTTLGVNYMVMGYLTTGTWPEMSPIDPAITGAMARLSESASYYNALTGAIPPLPGVQDQYIRAGYFSQGYGRTSIGFSESMSQMSGATRSRLRLRAFPWSDNTAASTMFYADVAGVNAQSAFLDNGGDAPFILANLMTSQAVMQDSIAPPGGELSYLFPARVSVLTALAEADPLYAQMASVLNSATSVLVSVPATDRDTFYSFGAAVQTEVLSQFQGHCDMESPEFIWSNDQAQSVCPQVCANSGGWIGSWTNVAPPAWPGYSACGCAQCTSSSPIPGSGANPASAAESGLLSSPANFSPRPTVSTGDERRYSRN